MYRVGKKGQDVNRDACFETVPSNVGIPGGGPGNNTEFGSAVSEKASLAATCLLERDGQNGMDVRPGGGGLPYLVATTHNFTSYLERRWEMTPEERDAAYCPNARMTMGTCAAHGQHRLAVGGCKRRGCPCCGPRGRWEIAKRIEYGIRELGQPLCRGHYNAAWSVLTFGVDVTKSEATRRLRAYIRWLRLRNPGMEYVATYELTRRGRLHINLICAPWVYVSHAELYAKWGTRISVEWVKDGESMGKEAAKSYSAGSLAGYLSKLEQSVPTDRRVSYSCKSRLRAGWPKLPRFERVGDVEWRPVWEWQERHQLEADIMRGFLTQTPQGDYAEPNGWGGWPVWCECFDFVGRGPGPPWVVPEPEQTNGVAGGVSVGPGELYL